MKNKFLIIVLSVMTFTQLFNMYRCFMSILQYSKLSLYELIPNYVMSVIYYACGISICIFVIICILCKTNFTNSVRYTYEQYKEMRQKKKAEKQKAMKEKLQKQLNELEKD